MDDDQELFILSGYSLIPRHFRRLVRSLCRIRRIKQRRHHFMDYVIAYDFWRRKLPKDVVEKVPEVICAYPLTPRIVFASDRELGIYDDSPDENPIRYFFFTRFVPFKDDTQLNPKGEHSSLWSPADKDKARLAEFEKLVQGYGGQLNSEELEFECCKRDMYVSKRRPRY
ncbi:hypothetical protein D9757_013973 [Collybiopsis confluens]|uniref:Uncharacterized protein n=1 Tax=Collybiopsis confluens TaxID=2823264 RepID=A0A8H5LQL7_9AGAR|nr:hypothetical protein D9757_013973 [Collybiopsis confluens]